MDIIIGKDIETMTGYKLRAHQVKWFKENGITCKVSARGQVWTCKDWLNGADKEVTAANDDSGFNADFMNHG